MKKLTLDDLNNLSTGCAILGSGGGGDPTYTFMMARYEIEKNGPVSLIKPSEVGLDDIILPLGILGAPLAEMEKFSSGREFIIIAKELEQILNKKIAAVMPFEIGGGSAFAPVMAAAQLGIPLLDADMMGRAFPEAQMSACHLFGISPAPGAIVDCLDNKVGIYAKDSWSLEKIARHVAVVVGSTCCIGLYPVTGSQVLNCSIHKSLSKAISIGKIHREAKEKGEDPLKAILNLCKGVQLGSGRITDIDRVITKGFLNGNVIIQNKKDRIELAFQNEYLVAKYNGEVIATTPDILVLLEQETGVPIMCESLQFGLKVNLIAFPGPAIWSTPKGLSLVGPRYFGYEFDYQPLKSKS